MKQEIPKVIANEPVKFGTFSGVFVPNVLTILGVILFMRSGWVVGQAGVYNTLIILVLANSITLLTSLSLSAIATNTKVGGGGAYFLISRSLGLEVGGSIGVPLFLAQAVSVAFYIIGFTESITPFFPEIDTRLIAMTILAIIFLIAWASSDLAVKAQNVILIVLALSLLSFFLGFKPGNFLSENWSASYAPGFEFWTVFAIFFPAVTGVMAGASMSGDLKDPSKSIPIGTIGAVVVTFIIYAAQIFWLGKSAPRADLVGNTLIMNEISVFGPLIYAGLWAATISSAIASLLGAPRTLQALAMDGVFPRILAKKSGPKNEPRIALVVSVALAAACILIGDLNLIAPIISMFFLATYGMVNLVAGIERWVANPSFRPSFKVPWIFSMVGGLGCLVVMFLLSPWATIAAIILMLGLYIFLTTRQYQTAFGDTWSGFWFSLVRFGLLKFYKSRQHMRNWRPVILVLSGNPRVRTKLVEFASLFESKRGFMFLAQILTGDWTKSIARRNSAKESIENFIMDEQLSAEAIVLSVEDFEHGVSAIIQTCGVGPLVPNIVMVGWSEDTIKHALFRRTVQRILELQTSLLLFVEAEKEDNDLNPTIDVWWGAKVNGTMMLTLAHLLQCNPEWKECTIRLLLIVRNEAGLEAARSNLNADLKSARIEGEAMPIYSTDAPFDVIAKESQHSRVTFLGFNLQTLTEGDNPLQDYETFMKALKGHIFFNKNWRELTLK
ncbi:MAG: Na-K-Cl cotransporter [Verrucomicrobia bacterium]|nr:Na-K-Cl cotransporter [Verrucomicrobiota bacterium]MDA1064975.1 Na-K-Cl cotransporter [Verrucomicrobiota bacterium]